MENAFTPYEVFLPLSTCLARKAFTLAEVLITLGIIGVVAALTLPSLINDIQDKQYKAAFKKQYSAFSQAMQKVYIEEGETYQKVEWQKMPKYICKIQNKMHVISSGLICSNIDNINIENISSWPSSGKYLWHKDTKWYDKKGNPQTLNGGYRPLSFLLNDGTLINYNCTNQVFVDVNGYKKPNKIGRDIFYFVLNNRAPSPSFFSKNGTMIPNSCTITGSNATPTLTETNIKEDCKSGSGWGCSPMYILE